MQLPLFKSEEVTLTLFLPEDQKHIEDIVLVVAESGRLIRGESFSQYLNDSYKWIDVSKEKLKEQRLNRIIDFLSNSPSDGEYYTIRHGTEIIGFAAFWDGWLASECKYDTPAIELAFLHPDFKQKEYAERVLNEFFENYSKDCGWD